MEGSIEGVVWLTNYQMSVVTFKIFIYAINGAIPPVNGSIFPHSFNHLVKQRQQDLSAAVYVFQLFISPTLHQLLVYAGRGLKTPALRGLLVILFIYLSAFWRGFGPVRPPP